MIFRSRKINLLFVLINICFFWANAAEPVLKHSEGWKIDSIAPGQIWYVYKGYYAPCNSNQIINVTEIDLNRPEYKVEFKYVSSDSLSHVASMVPNAVAGINGTYLEIVDGKSTSFLKSNGQINRSVEISPDNLYFWKHEGAFYYDKSNSVSGIEYGDNQKYLAWEHSNIISGSPMLIDNYVPVGESFVKTYENLMQLPDENPNKHQGIRHPRTAIALTGDNKLLLIVVDGRRIESSGMNAKELTQFVSHFFNPKSCLNLDGGGSSTMWIKGSGLATTEVVNYPTDNNRYDHYGQRMHRNFLVITRTETVFSQGSGTQSDPYLISTPADLKAIHSLDWSINPEPYFKMVSDIDMKNEEWIPINSASPYSKFLHFDGNGHVIKNLTCLEQPYASLFGVLCGTCKNTGLLDVNIKSSNGAGAFGGFIGIVSPTSKYHTGIIENCYSSGKIEGVSAVGGIVGNIGKPFDGISSEVRNCYSTADLVGTYYSASPQAGGARVGGLIGVIWSGGVLKNSYSTSKVAATALYGSGGLVGFADTGIENCIAWNDQIVNAKSVGSYNAKIGKAIAYAHPANVQAYCKNIWSSNNLIMSVEGKDISTVDFSSPSYSYHGLSKSKDELTIFNIYSELGWDFVSDNNVWAQTASNGFPIFQWMLDRGDYDMIDGHKNKVSTPLPDNRLNADLKWTLRGRELFIQSTEIIEMLEVVNISGVVKGLHQPNAKSISVPLNDKGLHLIRIMTSKWNEVFKVIL